jgi:hypothetical protein
MSRCALGKRVHRPELWRLVTQVGVGRVVLSELDGAVVGHTAATTWRLIELPDRPTEAGISDASLGALVDLIVAFPWPRRKSPVAGQR